LCPEVERSLAPIVGATLEELDSFALQNRIDTKFVLTEPQVAHVLQTVGARYVVIEVNGIRAGHYQTAYFDTLAWDMYRDHHNGRRDRFKVRYRCYMDSGVSFLEVKRKNNRDRTIKTRIKATNTYANLVGNEAAFVAAQTPYAVDHLVPTVRNQFLRVSLASRDELERLTLDFSMSSVLGESQRAAPNLVIAEVKQPRFTASSPFVSLLRDMRIEPTAFSKYCLAVAQLADGVKRNNFKQRLLFLDRLSEVPVTGNHTLPLRAKGATA
jgi:hypothetical protein